MTNAKLYRRAIAMALRLIVFLFLFFCILELPSIVMDGSHDNASAGIREYLLVHHYTFGRDIVENVGPYGFLNYPSYFSGFLDLQKLTLSVFVNGVAAWLLQLIIFSLPFGWASLFYGLMLMFTVFFIQMREPYFYLFILLIGYFLCTPNRFMGRAPRIALVFTLGLLSLGKGMFFFLSIFAISCSFLSHLNSTQRRQNLIEVVCFFVFIAFLWLLAGQSPWILPVYPFKILSFATGYNDAMALYEDWRITAYALIALFGIIGMSFFEMFLVKKPDYRWAISLLLFAVLFAAWKHGFVRADEHVLIFFQFAPVAAVISVLIWESPKRLHRLGHLGVLSLVLATCYLGSTSDSWVVDVQNKYFKVVNSFKEFVYLPSGHAALKLKLKNGIDQANFGDLVPLVGKRSISYLGENPGWMPYVFNFVSPPTPISFASWNEDFQRANQRYYREDERAPAFVLAEIAGIDSRMATQDDALAKLELLYRYRPVKTYQGFLLLAREPEKGDFTFRSLGPTFPTQMDAWKDVPVSKFPIWVKIELKKRFFGQILSTLYKPPEVWIEMKTAQNKLLTYRLVTTTAHSGFMIDPLIENNLDFVRAWRALRSLAPIRSDPKSDPVVAFRVFCGKMQWFCKKSVDVNFSTIEGF